MTSEVVARPRAAIEHPDRIDRGVRIMERVSESHIARGERSAQRALLPVLVALAAFGLALVLAPGPVQRLFSWIAYGAVDRLDGFPPDAVAYIRLVHGILGAVTLGWALTLIGAVGWTWRRDPVQAWWIVVVATGTWFVSDTLHSLWSGFGRNAVFNALVAAALAVPLVWLRPRRGGSAAETRASSPTRTEPVAR
jgi:ABC-type enterobactin transport system permease subunit